MVALQSFMANNSIDAKVPLDALEAAALAAEGVLKSEWRTVTAGEEAYRDAVRATKYTLRISFGMLALLLLGYPIYYWTASDLETKTAKRTLEIGAPAQPSAPAPAPRQAASSR